MRLDGAEIKAGGTINLSQVLSFAVTIACIDTSIVDTLNALINYAGTFVQQYGIPFADTRSMDILDAIVSSEHFLTRSRSTHNPFVSFAKLTIKYEELLYRLQKSEEDGTARKFVSTSHLDSALLMMPDLKLVCYLLERPTSI